MLIFPDEYHLLVYEAYLNVVELLGNEYYFHFQLGQNDVSTKTPKDKAYVPNTFADLTFDLGKNHLFDDISGGKII